MPSLWKTASHISIAIWIVAVMAVPPGIPPEGESAGSAAAAAQAAIGNVAEHIKAVPDQVNSLLSKYAPGLAEADMKQYTAKKDGFMRHIGQLSGQLGAIANKVVSENPGIERNFHTAKDVVSQHIEGLADQVGSFASKVASENPGIETSFRTAQDIVSQHIKQLPDQVSLLASKCDLKDTPILCNPHLQTAALIAGGTVIGAVAAPAAIAALGFSTGGVVAGSVAAGLQAGIGNVAAGSAFAIMQSAGTAPLLSGIIGATVGAATGGTAAVVNLKATEADEEPAAKEKVDDAAINYICTEFQCDRLTE